MLMHPNDLIRGPQMSLEEKRKAAIEYLKQRKIYVLDNKFKPTPPPATDIASTIARYRREVDKKVPFTVKAIK